MTDLRYDVRTCWSCRDFYYPAAALDMMCPACVNEGAVVPRKVLLSAPLFSRVLEFQHYSCAICGEQTGLVVDHDHAAHTVRGLLCTSCNTRLGMYRDSTVRLRRAGHTRSADYLTCPPLQEMGVRCSYAGRLHAACSRPELSHAVDEGGPYASAEEDAPDGDIPGRGAKSAQGELA